MRALIRSTALAASLALVGFAQQAQAAVFSVPGLDTVTDLQISWFWNAAGGSSTYQGTHWNVDMKAALAADKWTVDVWYTHLDGPHGETVETVGAPHHKTASFSASGFGVFSQSGTDDHLPIDFHLAAHQWLFNGSGTPFSGASALAVSHPVPEPRSAAMLAAGLAVMGLLGQRRRNRR